jgi:hypothetical protein
MLVWSEVTDSRTILGIVLEERLTSKYYGLNSLTIQNI